MCLIIFAHQTDSRFPLVVAANRDEFFSRASEDLSFWNDNNSTQGILAGRDLLGGGTWLGLGKSGRFAAVTNIRDPSQLESKTRSRGELCVDFLAGNLSAQQYARSLAEKYQLYAGFNLLLSDGTEMYYVNNTEGLCHSLEPGLYGLSNSFLNADWPKVRQGRERLQTLMLDSVQSEKLSTDELIRMMDNRELAADSELPSTGVGIELERSLSSAFIHNSSRQYGTRCSSAIVVAADGGIRFNEQNYDESGRRSSAHFYQYRATT